MPKTSSSGKSFTKRKTRNVKEKIAATVAQSSLRSSLKKRTVKSSNGSPTFSASRSGVVCSELLVSEKPTQRNLDCAKATLISSSANADTERTKIIKRTKKSAAVPTDSSLSADKKINKVDSNVELSSSTRKRKNGSRHQNTDIKEKPSVENSELSLSAEHFISIAATKPTTTGSRRKRKNIETTDKHKCTESDYVDQQSTNKTEAHVAAPEASSPKRRRGRPPKTKIAKNGSNAKGKKSSKIEGDNSASDEISEDEAIKCSHCQFTSTEHSKIKFHYASVHTLLYSKSEPHGTDNVASLKKVFKMLGGKVTCPHCQKSIKTAAYYKRHVEWCQSDRTLMAMCHTCNKEMKAFWIHEHEVACKKKQAEKELTEQKVREKKVIMHQSADGTGKRRAASKALKNIKHINNEKEDFDWTTLFSTPYMTVPSEDVIREWQTCCDSGTPLACAHEGCSTTCSSLNEITEHYWTCTFNGLACHTWNCRKCSQTFHSEKEALVHVKAKHEPASRRKKLDDDYQSDGVSVSDEEVSSGVTTGDEDEGAVSSGESEGDKLHKSNKDYKAGSGYPPIVPTFSRHDLCASLHSPTSPRLASLLPDEKAGKGELFVPTDSHSRAFTIGGASQTHRLFIGQTTPHLRGCVTYLGAPIKTATWCPFDRTVQSEVLAGDQYIAILPGAASSTDAAPNHIDIWRVSNLSRSKETATEFSIVLHLTHSYGRVNQIKWSHDGGFVQSTEASPIGRLGLLAVAASRGSVHIISVPYLGVSSNKAASYSADKHLELLVPGNEAECTCVDWQRGDHKFVFGGFDDGSVAIWYVGGKHTSLSLPPVKVFLCHTSFVTCITSCPFNCNVFATFSHGWLAWDLRDMQAPYLTPKVIDWCLDLHTKAVWPRMHPTIVSCTDPSFGSSAVSMLSLGYDPIAANQKTPVRGLQVTTDADVCDCSDILVVGDTRGIVRWHRPILPKYVKGLEKNGAQRTFKNLTALRCSEVEQGDTSGCLINFDYLICEKQTSGGVKGNVCDMNTLSENKRFHSINSVAINPNAGCHHWLLCAGEHGLAHLISLDQ